MAETNILSISLKDYKKQIDDLKGSLLSLKKGSSEYESVLQEVRDRQNKLNEVLADSKRTSDIASNSMNALKAQLREMKQEAGNLDVGSDRFKELSASILETTDKLKELESSQGTFSRNVGNYEGATVSLKGQLKEITAQMAEMLNSGMKPTDEAFVELAKKAGDLKDAIADSNAVVKHFADDTKGLSSVIDLAKTGTAAFGVYKGTLQLFGVENENVNETMATMATVMGTLNSLQQLQTALVDRASITYRLYHGVIDMSGKALAFLGLTSKSTTASTVAETTAIGAHSSAMVADTAATSAATVATNLFKKALIATGIGAIVVAIGTLIAHLDDLVNIFKSVGNWIGKTTGLIKEQTTAEKIAATQAKKHKEELDELAKKEKELSQESISLRTTYEKLQSIWANTKSLTDRQKFVEQYKNEMSSLGVEVNNVNDAERFFSNEGATAFAKSIEIRARLALAQTKLMQAIQKEEKAVSEQWMGDALYRVQQQKEEVLNEITSLSSQLSKLTPKSSTPKTTPSKSTKTSTKTETKVDVSGEMEKLERQLKEQTSAIDYAYDLLVAKGKATVKDEIEHVTTIYQVTTDIIQKEIDDRKKQLENAKITSEQIKQIQDEIYNLEQKKIESNREYTIENEKLILKVRKETLDELKKSTEKSIKEENELFKSNNVISIYTDMLKGAEPEIATQIINSLSIDEDSKQKIIDNLDLFNSDKEELIHNYYLQQEEAEYQHQLKLIQIQKDALVQLSIDFGEDSEEYLAQKQIIYDKEEEITRKHFDNLTKIEQKHNEASKKSNKLTTQNYLDMANGISSIMGSIAGIMEDDIRNKKENGEISEEEAKKQFETVKALQIAAATIDMISGAVQAYATAQSLGPVAGPIIGGINAAAVTAMGIANINQIKQQQFGSSSTSGVETGGATRETTNIDFSGVSVNPLLDEQADINRLTTLSETQPSEQRVYILQSDISNSQKQVEIRQSNTTF